MAAYGDLQSGVAGGSVTTIDSANLAVTGADLCLVVGGWEGEAASPAITLTYDPAGDNDAMTGTLGQTSVNSYMDADLGWLDNPEALTVPVRATFASAVDEAGVFGAFFTAAGDVVSTDSAIATDDTAPTTNTVTPSNVVEDDMVIDFVSGTATAARTWTAGTNQTERLDQTDGAYSSAAVSTQLGVNGGAMQQTASAGLAYGLVHFGLRIPNAAASASRGRGSPLASMLSGPLSGPIG